MPDEKKKPEVTFSLDPDFELDEKKRADIRKEIGLPAFEDVFAEDGELRELPQVVTKDGTYLVYQKYTKYGVYAIYSKYAKYSKYNVTVV